LSSVASSSSSPGERAKDITGIVYIRLAYLSSVASSSSSPGERAKEYNRYSVVG
jgi:hypothetical protein